MGEGLRLHLLRSFPQETETIGDLFIEDQWECHTLEDRIREDNPQTPENEGAKIPGETAIPYGTYRWSIEFSPRFQRLLPRLDGVPGFAGILIHPGNTHRDTEGCILVGDGISEDHRALLRSRQAFDRLYAKLSAAKSGTITILKAAT